MDFLLKHSFHNCCDIGKMMLSCRKIGKSRRSEAAFPFICKTSLRSRVQTDHNALTACFRMVGLPLFWNRRTWRAMIGRGPTARSRFRRCRRSFRRKEKSFHGLCRARSVNVRMPRPLQRRKRGEISPCWSWEDREKCKQEICHAKHLARANGKAWRSLLFSSEYDETFHGIERSRKRRDEVR